MSASDADWASLTDAYGQAFDPRPLLARFAQGMADDRCWGEVWDRLHHQGDVGTASFAIVPRLVEHSASQARSWQIYAYVATLEECRRDPDQPQMPSWVEGAYRAGLDELSVLAQDDVANRRGAGFLVSLFAFMAAKAGSIGLAVALLNIGDNESAMDDLARYGDSLHDL